MELSLIPNSSPYILSSPYIPPSSSISLSCSFSPFPSVPISSLVSPISPFVSPIPSIALPISSPESLLSGFWMSSWDTTSMSGFSSANSLTFSSSSVMGISSIFICVLSCGVSLSRVWTFSSVFVSRFVFTPTIIF